MRTPGGLDAADGHAQVLVLQHHPGPARLQLLGEPAGDLAGEPLLGLEVAGEQLDHPGQLGQAEDAVAGEVADAGQAGERQQVVLTVVAGRVPLDVLAERRGTTRGALYKTIHDARRKLRAHLAEAGLLAGRR